MPTIGQMRSTGWHDGTGTALKPRGELWWFTSADGQRHVYDWSYGSAHCDTRIRYAGGRAGLASLAGVPAGSCGECGATARKY